jgi:hypothetical protein
MHGLRKTAACMLADGLCSTHEIASISGHKSLKEIERYNREANQRMLASAEQNEKRTSSGKRSPVPSGKRRPGSRYADTILAAAVNLSLTKSAKPAGKIGAASRRLSRHPANDKLRSVCASWWDCLSIRPCAGKMRKTGTAELPRARRTWMGPPLAALGFLRARARRVPVPNRCVRSRRTAAMMRLEPSCSRARVLARHPHRSVSACRWRHSTTSRDGVAHEAPLSTVWRVFESARQRNEPHAST